MYHGANRFFQSHQKKVPLTDLRANFWTQELWENQFKLFLTSTAVICGSSRRELMKERTKPDTALARSSFHPGW